MTTPAPWLRYAAAALRRERRPTITISGALRYEPNSYGGSMCHVGAGPHDHSADFLEWWRRWGADIARKGPPTSYYWTTDMDLTEPRWDDEHR